MRSVLDAQLAGLARDPRAALAQPEMDALLLDGVLRAPALDRTKLQRLVALPPDLETEGGDERVVVYLLDTGQARAEHVTG